LHIKYIVLDSLKSYGSASASDCIGIISINCKNSFTEIDIEEMIIHELVHNLIFIDNLNHTHFKKSFNLNKYLVFSPIRETSRRIDLSFHAFLVSLELLNLRLISSQKTVIYTTI
jgi:hypothetical protein